MTMTPPLTDCWDRALAAVAAAWPPRRWRDVGVVVGCSGGADSVALLIALCQLRQSAGQGRAGGADDREPPRGFLVAAHWNHALRGEQSAADEAFVAALAEQQDVRFASARATRPARDEAGMRAQRLRFLRHTAEQAGARYIALAHSADDNVETVLHHLLRGTGPAGLAGIGSPRAIGPDLVLVRPLLGVGRTLLRGGLSEIGQSWREDASNQDLRYRRNWIRHRLIPLIQSEYPGAVAAIGRAIEGQREWRTVLDREACDWLQSHRRGQHPLRFARDLSTDRAVIVAAAQQVWTELGWSRRQMRREHWLRLAATIQSRDEERYSLPGEIDVRTSGNEVECKKPFPSGVRQGPVPGHTQANQAEHGKPP
jgi:tRNA(Ile)-lysidine synthase